MPFQLESNYRPRGDQGQAIGKLLKSVEVGNRHQTLLGVTGSGKTFSIANVIQELDRPTLVISHNKTLAAQLYSEFKQFFPRNAVEYFVSYFDYYQPEAYIPRSDTYIEKDSSINEEIERLRLAATSALLSRRDTIVVASVSCIYGITSPEDYLQMLLTVKRGQQISREAVLGRLIDMLYERNDVNFARGRFRVRGDVVEVYPGSADEEGIRLEFFGDEIDAIRRFDPLTGHAHESLSVITFFPAKQFVTPADKLNRALRTIREELEQRIVELESQNKLLEAQRLRMRTEYDLEMLQEMGFCNGIENYSRHLSGRPPGSKPYTIMDFFPKDRLVVIDESHATIRERDAGRIRNSKQRCWKQGIHPASATADWRRGTGSVRCSWGKTPNSERFREQAVQRPTSNVQFRNSDFENRRAAGEIRRPHAGCAARCRADHPSDWTSRSKNHSKAAEESDR